jgi:hypothetical protein
MCELQSTYFSRHMGVAPRLDCIRCSVLVDVAAYLGKPPFANPAISRSLTLEDIRVILDSVREPRTAILVFWLLVFLTRRPRAPAVCDAPADGRRRRLRVGVARAQPRLHVVEECGPLGG